MLCILIGLMHTPFFLKKWLSIASAGRLEDSIFDQWSIVDGILGFCPAGILVSKMVTSSAFRTVEPLAAIIDVQNFLCIYSPMPFDIAISANVWNSFGHLCVPTGYR